MADYTRLREYAEAEALGPGVRTLAEEVVIKAWGSFSEFTAWCAAAGRAVAWDEFNGKWVATITPA